jgi:hypothetical protein
MTTRKLTAIAAALATAATLAVAAGPANAASRYSTDYNDTTYSYEPTGPRTLETDSPHRPYEAGDEAEECQNAVANANEWMEIAADRYLGLVKGDWKEAQAIADENAGKANAKGCTITHQE